MVYYVENDQCHHEADTGWCGVGGGAGWGALEAATTAAAAYSGDQHSALQ